MGNSNGTGWLVVLSLVLAFPMIVQAGYAGGPAGGGGVAGTYDVEVLVGGSASYFAMPGETVPVEIVMSPQAGDLRIGAAIFDITISNGGLRFDDAEWNQEYFMTGDSVIPPPIPTHAIETSLHGEVLTETGDHLFHSGTILTVDLTVPDESTLGSTYEIAYHHDTLTEDGLFTFHDASVLGPLTITVVPEPGTVVLLGAGVLVALRRRKKSIRAMANSVQPNRRMT